MQKQRVVVVCTNRGAVEFVVPGVLQADAHVRPRPSRCRTRPERDIRDLSYPAVAVWTDAARKPRIEQRVGRSPDAEVLAGENDAVVTAECERPLQPQRVECVRRIGCRPARKARVELLKLADIAAAQRQPETVALVLVLRVVAEIREAVPLRQGG